MRREIKFRAWKRPTKTLAYGVYPHGSYVCFPNSLPLPEDKQTPYSGDKQDGYFEARKCELMQFTGLHDKNGKEIYEGDVVEHGSRDELDFGVGTVERNREWACFELKCSYDWGDTHTSNEVIAASREWRVIGNIYEHGHLLENESKE